MDGNSILPAETWAVFERLKSPPMYSVEIHNGDTWEPVGDPHDCTHDAGIEYAEYIRDGYVPSETLRVMKHKCGVATLVTHTVHAEFNEYLQSVDETDLDGFTAEGIDEDHERWESQRGIFV